jgi:hypothetical protein
MKKYLRENKVGIIVIAILVVTICILFSCGPNLHKAKSVSHDVNISSITYSDVEYVAATPSSAAYVQVWDGSLIKKGYRDYGGPWCSARCQFDSFYISAYHKSGVVSWSDSDGILLIDQACSSCTSISASPAPTADTTQADSAQ